MNRIPAFLVAVGCYALACTSCGATDEKSMQGNSDVANKLAAKSPLLDVYPPGPATALELEQQPSMDSNLLMKHISAAPHATTKKQCKQLRGRWMKAHFGDGWICDLPTPDADKVCRDDSECTLYCRPDRHSAWGKDSTGSCETHYYFLGCIHGMSHGRPSIGPCAD